MRTSDKLAHLIVASRIYSLAERRSDEAVNPGDHPVSVTIRQAKYTITIWPPNNCVAYISRPESQIYCLLPAFNRK